MRSWLRSGGCEKGIGEARVLLCVSQRKQPWPRPGHEKWRGVWEGFNCTIPGERRQGESTEVLASRHLVSKVDDDTLNCRQSVMGLLDQCVTGASATCFSSCSVLHDRSPRTLGKRQRGHARTRNRRSAVTRQIIRWHLHPSLISLALLFFSEGEAGGLLSELYASCMLYADFHRYLLKSRPKKMFAAISAT
jgi:hypothetical protein